MRGLYEWIAFTAGMALAGLVLLAFFFNPLLLVLIVFAIGLYVAVSRFVTWMSAPASGGRAPLTPPSAGSNRSPSP